MKRKRAVSRGRESTSVKAQRKVAVVGNKVEEVITGHLPSLGLWLGFRILFRNSQEAIRGFKKWGDRIWFVILKDCSRCFVE